MKTIATILFCLLLSICAQAANFALVSTMGKGVGVTAEEALKDSFRDAVERAVGVFVDAEQQAQNDQLIRDSVLTHSNAYIEKYKRVSERMLENGLWEVKIVADVKKGELTRKLRDVMPEKTFSLGDELKRQYGERQKVKIKLARKEEALNEQKRQQAAKDISQKKRDADAAMLIKNTLADFNPTAMMVDINAIGTKPIVKEVDGETMVGFDMSLALSEEKYFKTLVPRLKQLFGQITLKKPQTVRFILDSADLDRTPTSLCRFFDGNTNMNPLAIPRSALWKRNVEIDGSAYMMPDCRMSKVNVNSMYCQDEPNVWIVESVQKSGFKVRVCMTGYVIADVCCDAIADVVTTSWGTLPAVEYMAELVDSSGETVTSHKFRVSQDLGWIGIGDGIAANRKSFYVMPWVALPYEVEVKGRYKEIFDDNGNFLGWSQKATVEYVSHEVRLRCFFKVLEEELKSAKEIRVRVCD